MIRTVALAVAVCASLLLAGWFGIGRAGNDTRALSAAEPLAGHGAAAVAGASQDGSAALSAHQRPKGEATRGTKLARSQRLVGRAAGKSESQVGVPVNDRRVSGSAARQPLNRMKVRRGEWRSLWSQRARDWPTAAGFVGRFVFPGTRGWLLRCSSSEGGHGPFVLNRQGSGAGGWMQFLASTHAAYLEQSWEAARRNGFRVPRRHARWRDPLAQAIVGAHMLLIGERRQWAGRLC